MPATVLLPAPGGPATTGGRGALMPSEDMVPPMTGPRESMAGPRTPFRRAAGQ